MHSIWMDIFVVLAVMATGGVLPLLLPRIRPYLPVALSVSAGIMLGTACLHLLPDAMTLVGAKVGWALLAGFLFLYFFEQFVTVHICEAMGCEVHHIGIAALFGLSVHTFVNGVAMGAGYISGIGGLVTLAVAAHKLPEAFSLTAILLHENYRRVNIMLMSLLFMSMIPLGVVAVRLFAVSSESPLTGYTLAFSAGTFLHIAVSDLLPEVHRSSHRRSTILTAFVVGIAVTALAAY